MPRRSGGEWPPVEKERVGFPAGRKGKVGSPRAARREGIPAGERKGRAARGGASGAFWARSGGGGRAGAGRRWAEREARGRCVASPAGAGRTGTRAEGLRGAGGWGSAWPSGYAQVSGEPRACGEEAGPDGRGVFFVLFALTLPSRMSSSLPPKCLQFCVTCFGGKKSYRAGRNPVRLKAQSEVSIGFITPRCLVEAFFFFNFRKTVAQPDNKWKKEGRMGHRAEVGKKVGGWAGPGRSRV